MLSFTHALPNSAIPTIVYPNAATPIITTMLHYSTASFPVAYSRLVLPGELEQRQAFNTQQQPFLANPLLFQHAAFVRNMMVDIAATRPPNLFMSGRIHEQDIISPSPVPSGNVCPAAAPASPRTFGESSVQLDVSRPFPKRNRAAHTEMCDSTAVSRRPDFEDNHNIEGEDVNHDIEREENHNTEGEDIDNTEGERPRKRRKKMKKSDRWYEHFNDLRRFLAKTGHCLIPCNDKEHDALFRWAKRQRYQYKLVKDGKSSSLTLERIKALDELGFTWSPFTSQWDERLSELKDYKREHGDCNVPSSYTKNPKLAVWVKMQRRRRKLLDLGKPSNMTLERIERLDNLGFKWEFRSRKQQRTC